MLTLADNSTYLIEPKGFWGTTIELKSHETVLLNFKMNWNGNIIIHTTFDHTERDFIFQHKGVFKDRYVLLDQQEQELLVVQPNFKWNKFNYDYSIVTTDNFEAFAFKDILLLTTVHCANYYTTMMSTTIT